jgi:hypothetical protein
MKVVMSVAIPEVLRFRQGTGADRFDEMWEGVLHMTASPSFQHQALASRILNFFVEVWCPRTGGAAVMQVNVSTQDRWDQDYRIPDVSVLIAPLGIELRAEPISGGSSLHLRFRGEPGTDRPV